MQGSVLDSLLQTHLRLKRLLAEDEPIDPELCGSIIHMTTACLEQAKRLKQDNQEERVCPGKYWRTKPVKCRIDRPVFATYQKGLCNACWQAYNRDKKKP